MTASPNVRAAIQAANENFMATYNRGDATGMAPLYAANGQLLPPGAGVVEGKEGIQAVWQSVMDMGIKEAKLETVELEDHGTTAIEVGRYTLSGDGGQVMDSGKFVVVWKQEGGQWKLHRDIWNSSLAPPE